ncbi:MAG: hypothetical protein IKQ35_02105 [Bacilli bacterium]|nr:hypothetical protein [Bacilli bacterium]
MKKKLLFIEIILFSFIDKVYAVNKISCGTTSGIPEALPEFIRTIITLIEILVPLGLILFGSVDLLKVVFGEDKRGLDKAVKKFLIRSASGVIVFFIVFITLLFFENMDNSSSTAECIKCFTVDKDSCKVYYEEDEDHSNEKDKDKKEREELEKKREDNRKENEEYAKKEKELAGKEKDPDSVLKGKRRASGDLDFSCTSKTVKAKFSCETLAIVEQHLNDFNYYNFRDVIASYGGFNNYAQSLGGVFSEYYGKELNITTEYEFQKVAEYTFGWMYMYGMDYYNSGGVYQNWGVGYGSSGHSSDAFYPGNLRAGHWTEHFDANFDEVISGTGVNPNLWMATECGPAAQAPLYKGGVLKKGKPVKRTMVTKFSDLRPGDLFHFFAHPVNKADRSSWGQGEHVTIVGEVYDDKIVLYDGGSYFQTTRNFKREMKMVYTEAEEYKEVKDEFGYDYWAAERFADLQR